MAIDWDHGMSVSGRAIVPTLPTMAMPNYLQPVHAVTNARNSAGETRLMTTRRASKRGRSTMLPNVPVQQLEGGRALSHGGAYR